MSNPPTTIPAHCGRCQGTRNCGVRGHFRETGGDDDYHWADDWRLLQCLGCDFVFAQKVSTNSEDYDHDEDGNTILDEHVAYWPALPKRSRPEWFEDFGVFNPDLEKLNDALTEFYGAFDNDLVMLAGIGIRTSFDVASETLGIDPALTFEEKLEELVTRSHIGPKDRERIETLVDAGSASAHRGYKPNPDDLSGMTDILEHFVYEAIVSPAQKAKLDASAQKIKKKVPPKQKRQKKK